MENTFNIGSIHSVIQNNPDGTRDQVYMKVVPKVKRTCVGCYMFRRFHRNVSDRLCRMCIATYTKTGNDVQLEYVETKYQ